MKKNKWNRFTSVASRLLDRFPLRSECVWPGRATDLLRGHQAIYRFASEQAPRAQRVLDVGSGAGYGSSYLASKLGAAVVGIDNDRRFVRYASRKFASKEVSFIVQDAEQLSAKDAEFDLIIASNVLEHLRRPTDFLRTAGHLLRTDGVLVVAVPPIVNRVEKAIHDSHPFHVSNLMVDSWCRIHQQSFELVDMFAQRYEGSHTLDFTSQMASPVLASDFQFTPSHPTDFAECLALGCLIVCKAPKL